VNGNSLGGSHCEMILGVSHVGILDRIPELYLRNIRMQAEMTGRAFVCKNGVIIVTSDQRGGFVNECRFAMLRAHARTVG